MFGSAKGYNDTQQKDWSSAGGSFWYGGGALGIACLRHIWAPEAIVPRAFAGLGKHSEVDSTGPRVLAGRMLSASHLQQKKFGGIYFQHTCRVEVGKTGSTGSTLHYMVIYIYIYIYILY